MRESKGIEVDNYADMKKRKRQKPVIEGLAAEHNTDFDEDIFQPDDDEEGGNLAFL